MVLYNVKKIFNGHIFIIFIIFYFSFFINKHFGNIGVFPIDTFLHYDSGYRILNNQYPTRDFWVSFLGKKLGKKGTSNEQSHQ